MSDWRVLRLTKEVRKYDRALFCVRGGDGAIHLLRQPDRLAASDYNFVRPDASSLNVQFIFALTTDWTIHGTAVEWGIEPVMTRLRETDSWRDQTIVQKMREGRERDRDNKARETRNDLRARAADMRQEFARATNDINTSTLEKVEKRRSKDGHC